MPSCFACPTSLSCKGASHAEELVARAVKLGYSALALTDECSARRRGAGPCGSEKDRFLSFLLIGAHFHLQGDDGRIALSLILLAKNRNGYGNLSELITWVAPGQRRAPIC